MLTCFMNALFISDAEHTLRLMHSFKWSHLISNQHETESKRKGKKPCIWDDSLAKKQKKQAHIILQTTNRFKHF